MLKKIKLPLAALPVLFFCSSSLFVLDSHASKGNMTSSGWDEVDYDDGWGDFFTAKQSPAQKKPMPTAIAQAEPVDQGDPFDVFPEWNMEDETEVMPSMPRVNPSMPKSQPATSAPKQPASKMSGSQSDPFAAFNEIDQGMPQYQMSPKSTSSDTNKKESAMSMDSFTPVEEMWEVGFVTEDEMNGVTRSEDGTDTLSIDFPDEEIRNIIRSVADVYKLNVVIPENLVGVVAVKLHNVSWQQVFDAVLEPIGFAYIEENGIIKIKSQEALRTEPVENRMFALRFASASSVLGTVAGLIDPEVGGAVVADARTNVLIVTERPTRLKDIELVVKRLDAEEAQIMIETKVVEKKETDTDNIGVNWSSLSSYNIRALAGDTLSSDNGFNSGGFANFGRTDSSSGVLNTKNFTAVLSANTFDAFLSALTADTNNKLIASPNVVTMNNTPANIKIQDRQPVPNYEFNEQNGKLSISGFEYIDIGINVDVTPQAKEELITLDITPTFSTQSASVTIGGSDSGSLQASVPVISERTTKSVVTLKSGYTVALGGLMKEEHTLSYSRIPGLGHLPVLGRLFTHENNEATVTNLILFVTATQIGFNGEVKYEANGGQVLNANPRLMNELGITTKDIPGAPLAPQEKNMLSELRRLREDVASKQRQDRLEDQVEAVNVLNKSAQHELDKNEKSRWHRNKAKRKQKV